MNKKLFKTGLITGLILSLILGFLFYKSFLESPTIDVSNMNLVDLNGVNLETRQLLDKPLVINYWATWCSPCVEEFPAFEEIVKKNKEKVNFIFVTDESLNKVFAFKNRSKYDLNFVSSPVRLTALGINVRPTTYFFNKSGVLENTVVGGMDKNTLNENISELLNK